MRNRGQKILLDDFKCLGYVAFSLNVDWYMMVINSLKMRNLGFESFFESGISVLAIA